MFGLRLDPIAFSIGAISVHWYGIILGTAALVGLLLAVREGRRFGLSPDFFMDLLLLGVPSAIVGARIYYVMFTWDEYKGNPLDVFKIWHGGIAIYGALIGAFACGVIYFRVKGYSFWRVADICAPSLIAGQMIGRWGNFVNQEAFGGPVEESFLRHTLHLPNWIVDQMLVDTDGLYHHPTFLYESLWNLVGLILLLVIRRRQFLRAGELLFSYFIWYSIGRFFIEGLRTDSLAFHGAAWAAKVMDALWSPMKLFGFDAGYLNPAEGNIRISQLISVLLIIAAVTLIIGRRTTGGTKVFYSDPIINYKTGLPAGTEAAAKQTAVPAESHPDVKDHSDEAGRDTTIKE
ncbi:prolipoprotein diacylglyceryl transferase [Paenibacillus albus]|uniref:Phosphatidylglycerol--prolipoprotein diacylglyceryl transferase n=1 Tax=Paenibacillus albus TaxID=2495582 RepID=A0A3Q8X545_9BACL|nr:prolipoprotein diacylglyceryl transferase [Paenibacillus albus]AZN39127.1 prolipoprotein diacylglyceryl transferase [Paenibacillus albus]